MAKKNKDKDKINWDFKAETITDYLLKLELSADNKMLHTIFNKAKHKLARKKGMQNLNTANLEVIQQFDIPQKFFNLIHTIMHKQIKKCFNLVKEDNIHVLNSKVTKAKFKRNDTNDWDIEIQVTGQYVDKN